jgi:hypothetical protein
MKLIKLISFFILSIVILANPIIFEGKWNDQQTKLTFTQTKENVSVNIEPIT